jgi:hypothetical protein
MEKIKETSNKELNKNEQNKRVISYTERLSAMRKAQGKLDERR